LFVLKAIVLILLNYIKTKIALNYEERTRSNLYKLFLHTDWPYLIKQKLGHLEVVLMTNVEASSGMLVCASNLIMIVANLIVYTLIAINISWFITLMTLGMGGLMFLVLKPLIGKVRLFSYEQEDVNKQTSHHVNENILGMKTIKTMSVADKVSEVGRYYFNFIKSIKIRTFLTQAIIGSLTEPISLIFISVFFALTYKSANFNIIAFIAVIYLIRQIFAFSDSLQKQVLSIITAIPFLKNVLRYEDEAVKNKEHNFGGKRFQFDKVLEFKDVSFSYNDNKITLGITNFSIKKGEMVGLIGPSGAGKTTIVDLILRLLKPSSGEILIDGISINEIDIEDWRRNIGYVSQDIFLKNDTIADNIRFYNKSISDKDIEEAAKMAQIYDFIQELPDKFSTVIGERGILLSGGQRQRIVIARILAKKPKLLILDEATSSLDNESETQIQKVIENLKNRITVFVIAHRLTTLINSDRLLVLENGKIIEEGRPHELLKSKDTYFYRVYNIKK
jgi:ABC-type multidrug transport system fused ATPase/permease subunit